MSAFWGRSREPAGSAAYDQTVPVTDASDLSGLPRERSVRERAALAKVLRGEGRREEAKRVAGLRKPSIAAWAVNQLARAQRAALGDLFAVGDELLRVHAELLDGRGDPSALRAAMVRERDAVNQLTQAAHGLLSGAGHELSAATLERVSETLHAAAREEQARDLVRVGCLERELRLVGLGSDAVSGPASREPRAAGAGPLRTPDPDPREPARFPEAQADAEQTDASGPSARRHADRAARELGAAQERRDRAAQALRDAGAALVQAQAQADAAASIHRSAQHALQSADRPAASPA